MKSSGCIDGLRVELLDTVMDLMDEMKKTRSSELGEKVPVENLQGTRILESVLSVACLFIALFIALVVAFIFSSSLCVC